MTHDEAWDSAIAMARNLLGEQPVLAETTLQNAATTVIQALQIMDRGKNLNPSELAQALEELYNVWVGNASTLIDDSTGHYPWLEGRHDEIDWSRWKRYRTYLMERKVLSPQTLDRMDRITDTILGLLEDPARPGGWDRRGLVVGQVQSGKTTNYTGLISKAADAGYKLIVVLAGVHDSLRSQTQLRLDEEFIGLDSRKLLESDSRTPIGVGLLPGSRDLRGAHTLTTSADKGDFRVAFARQLDFPVGGEVPILLVVKKNKTVLETLNRWVTSSYGSQLNEDGLRFVRGIPLLVIDDEADHASINTKSLPRDEHGMVDREADPTTINRLIRKLLYSFEQSAYVGYTATPFANIFIYRDQPHPRHGPDLFPSSFIINLPAPSNYVGPVQVFGLHRNTDTGAEGREGLPIVREIDDYAAWMPDGHKIDHDPGPLPDSLKQAIRAFILASAIRASRGQVRTHNSMLVHVTRFTRVQMQVAEQIEQELSELRLRLRYGDGSAPKNLVDELRELWELDFQPTTARVLAQPSPDSAIVDSTWAEIEPFLKPAVEKIRVMQINGNAQDSLVYKDHSDGLSIIAIGGDKLSRGLTLEGLTVSYYLRASRMYDTLMQMGRWFGYRPGYLDVCRLYTTEELCDWYRDITVASEELRDEFDHMAALNATPEEFGLRVRTHPAGLMVTASNKMKSGTKLKLSYSGTVSETVAFHRDHEQVRENFVAVESLIEELTGTPDRVPDKALGSLVWRNQSPDAVLAFLDAYRVHPGARRVVPELLKKYIRRRIVDGELTDWSVALISNSLAPADRRYIAEWQIGLIKRSSVDGALTVGDPYRIRRLLSPTDEAIDITDEEWMRMSIGRTVGEEEHPLEVNGRRDRSPSGPAIRAARDPRRGLLLLYPLHAVEAGLEETDPPVIGFAISFPKSERVVELEYVVNSTYWDQEFVDT